MTDLNSFKSINLSQFFDSVKFQSGSGSGYHLVIDFCIVMFYLLMILMKFSFLVRIWMRIVILLWISLPDLDFIHRRHPPNFVWIR